MGNPSEKPAGEEKAIERLLANSSLIMGTDLDGNHFTIKRTEEGDTINTIGPLGMDFSVTFPSPKSKEAVEPAQNHIKDFIKKILGNKKQ